jgi:hypothetical protein
VLQAMMEARNRHLGTNTPVSSARQVSPAVFAQPPRCSSTDTAGSYLVTCQTLATLSNYVGVQACPIIGSASLAVGIPFNRRAYRYRRGYGESRMPALRSNPPHPVFSSKHPPDQTHVATEVSNKI